MPTDGDAGLFRRLDRIDGSLGQVRESIYSERDARLVEAEALRLKFYTARRAVRRSKWAAVFAGAAAVLAIGASVVAIVAVFQLKHATEERAADAVRAEQDRVNGLVVNCVNANAARVARAARDEQIGATLLDALAAILPSSSPEAAEQRRQTIAAVKDSNAQLLRDSLPPELRVRDCSVEAVTNPTLINPPAPK
jgi:hypothetical protein